MKVWFNKGLSNTFDAVKIIQAEDRNRSIKILLSHTDSFSLMSQAGGDFIIEPSNISDDFYVEWCLEQCKLRHIDLFIPQRRRDVISREQKRFNAIGVRLSVMGDKQIMDLVEKKHALYDDLKESGIAIPPFRIVRTTDEFDAAYEELRQQAPLLCVKPDVGIFGAGFRILEEEGDDMKRLLSGDNMRLSLHAFRAALSKSAQKRDIMLMAYLPGLEHSVDVLAHKGKVVRAVSRAKMNGRQILEIEGPSIDIARFLTERYRLDGIFNVQSKDWNDQPYLLEINSRMSGGLLYSCMAGVALPYWSILLALGAASPADVPLLKAGISVAPYQSCMEV